MSATLCPLSGEETPPVRVTRRKTGPLVISAASSLLRAQYLSEPVLNELAEEVAGRLGVRVVLVYSGTNHASAVTYPSIDLVKLATRARPSLQPQRRERTWPAVPRVHPLRVQHDARAKLSEREFQDVQRLLAAACSAMSTWLLHHTGATSSQIATAYGLVSTGLDEDHAFVRRSGADIALLAAGVRIKRGTQLATKSHHLSEPNLEKLHEFTDPRAAAFHLARQLTGLVDDLLGLVAGDQIGDDQVLHCRCPAFPIYISANVCRSRPSSAEVWRALRTD